MGEIVHESMSLFLFSAFLYTFSVLEIKTKLRSYLLLLKVYVKVTPSLK